MQRVEERDFAQVFQQHLLKRDPVEQRHDVAVFADLSLGGGQLLVRRHELGALQDGLDGPVVGRVLDQMLAQVGLDAHRHHVGQHLVAHGQLAGRRCQVRHRHTGLVRCDEIPHARERLKNRLVLPVEGFAVELGRHLHPAQAQPIGHDESSAGPCRPQRESRPAPGRRTHGGSVPARVCHRCQFSSRSRNGSRSGFRPVKTASTRWRIVIRPRSLASSAMLPADTNSAD